MRPMSASSCDPSIQNTATSSSVHGLGSVGIGQVTSLQNSPPPTLPMLSDADPESSLSLVVIGRPKPSKAQTNM